MGAAAGKADAIRAMLEPTVDSLGFELWGLELLPQGRRSLLRLYIESERGVDVEDCAEVSRHVSAVLDVEDPIRGEYTLEVSSPGADRRLFKAEHYLAYTGEWVEVRLRLPIEGRRKFQGTLLGLAGGDVTLQAEGREYSLPRENIERARVKPRPGDS